jgi:hypothetical protein
VANEAKTIAEEAGSTVPEDIAGAIDSGFL